MYGLWLIIAVQIAVESLPVSSSSHVRLAELFFCNSGRVMSLLPEYFDHLLHGPTVLIVALFFWREWFALLVLLYRAIIFRLKNGYVRERMHRLFRIIYKLIGLVFVCSVLPALALYGIAKPYLAGTVYADSLWVVLVGLFITMGALLSLRFLPHRFKLGVSRPLTIKSMFILGAVQALCLLIHGMSRFASTYVAARWLGFNNRRALHVSFLIEIPLISVAFLFNGVRNLLGTPGWQLLFTRDVNLAIIGATILGYLFLWFAWYLSKRELLWLFGIYMVVPIGLVIWKLV